MKLEIFDMKNNNLIIEKTKERDILINFLEILYTRDILNYKSKYIKHYKYNYSDKQKLEFINYQDNLRYVFTNIPTKWGYLDII